MTDGRAGFKLPTHGVSITVGDMTDARDAGYNDGFKQGQAEGYTVGLQSGQEELQQKMELELTKIRQLIQAMQHPFQGFREDLVKELKGLSIQLCETFLRHSIAEDKTLLEYLVDEAVKQLLPTDHQIAVHVNSRNSDVIQQALESHLEESAWRIQVNDKLSDGNVFLESGHSRVQINVNELLQQYLAQLGG